MNLPRVTAVLFRRQFDAAGASRRWPATATMASQPVDAIAARAVLGRKAARLVNKVPIASIVDVWTTILISEGPSVRSGYVDRAVSRALESAWFRLVLPVAQVDTKLNEELCGGGSNLGP